MRAKRRAAISAILLLTCWYPAIGQEASGLPSTNAVVAAAVPPDPSRASATHADGVVEAPAGSGGPPAAGRPWRNSLGMEFVPIPGATLLFCKVETRVQDYAAFVQRTGRKWTRSSIEQDPTHPAVNVTWDDAQAFCAWLTEREQKVGFLPAGCQYRLPKDLEWSVAVGLGPETGKTPDKRNGEIKGVYPWDGPFPPPAGAGNYAPVRAVDTYPYTAPVGSFATNRYGLHDLGGNVSEWCLDGWLQESFQPGPFRPGPGDKTLRGASWFHSTPWHLASSARDKAANNFDDIRIGFRVVLELPAGR